MLHRYALGGLLLALAMLLAACAAGADGAEEAFGPAGLAIDIASLTEAPAFIDWTEDGTPMQLIARRDAGGRVRLAFNTCQACGGSPYAWFEDLGDGTLQCQNCGLLFPLDSVGAEKAMGCNPVTIADFIVDGDTAIVPASVLSENAFRFANWKRFDGA